MDKHPVREKAARREPQGKGSGRQEQVQALRQRIRSGRYDADGKIDSLVDQLVRDAL